jgi:RNA-dependent RNA polymerase
MSLDPVCLKLAQLHSIAVDFQKSGKPADFESIPRSPQMRPDWSADELAPNYKRLPTNFYESRRALGVLFRNVALPELGPRSRKEAGRAVDDVLNGLEQISLGDDPIIDDPVTLLIRNKLGGRIDLSFDGELAQHILIPQFKEFSRHLTWICATYSLGQHPLTEEECWAGTIVAKSSQHRRRNDLQARMRQQCTFIADDIREDLAVPDDTEEWLIRTWVAWNIARRWERTFGAKLYGYLALGSLLEALAVIRQREESLYQ